MHDHTVLMVQVENEVGVLNDSRDRGAMADENFARPVPAELMSLFLQHKETLVPELREVWEANGSKTSGTWAEVFGPTKPKEFVLTWDLPEAQAKTEWRKLHWPVDEIFMAWHYSRYVNRVAEAGKREYNIPMYANAWLQQPGCAFPGTYPSGGPVPQVTDVWRAEAPSIDLLAPDLYVPEFAELCERYARVGQSALHPGDNRGPDAGRNLFLAVGAFNLIGFSPFGIDMPEFPRPAAPGPSALSPAARRAGTRRQLRDHGPDRSARACTSGNRTVSSALPWTRSIPHWSQPGRNGPSRSASMSSSAARRRRLRRGDGGRARRVRRRRHRIPRHFKPANPGSTKVGVGTVDEGVYHDGKWIPGRRLNGDETDQGRAWRFNSWALQIERCTTYRCE